MKIEPVVGIQPTVMLWARQSIGMSIDDVAEKIKRPPHEIVSWETGDSAPTYAQLEKLAYNIYKRPLAIFFLPAPPKETPLIREFRTLPDSDLQNLAPDTYLHIRRAHAFKLALSEIFDGKNPSSKNICKTLKLSFHEEIPRQAKIIREYIGISLQDQMSWKDDDYALKQWRKAIEDVGIFVFKSSFKQKEISAFCLHDNVLPIIYLNNSTTKTRQIFSLFHELAHLLFGINGLSKIDNIYVNKLPQNEKKIEQFCNAITAELLIPLDDFLYETKGLIGDIEEIPDDIFSDLANRYLVSRESILRRLLDLGRVSSFFYEKKAKEWTLQKKSGKGGGDWYSTQNTYLSSRFAIEVVSRHYRQQLSVEKAADLLGISPKNFSGLEQRIMRGAEI